MDWKHHSESRTTLGCIKEPNTNLIPNYSTYLFSKFLKTKRNGTIQINENKCTTLVLSTNIMQKQITNTNGPNKMDGVWIRHIF